MMLKAFHSLLFKHTKLALTLKKLFLSSAFVNQEVITKDPEIMGKLITAAREKQQLRVVTELPKDS